MSFSHELPPKRTYTEDELVGLMATYFGDRLTQTQLDSLVATVAVAHADRHERAPQPKQDPGAESRAPAPDP